MFHSSNNNVGRFGKLQDSRPGAANHLDNGAFRIDEEVKNEADRLTKDRELGDRRDQGTFVPYPPGFNVLTPLLGNLGAGGMSSYPMGGMGAMGGLPMGGMGGMGSFPMGGLGGMSGFPMGGMSGSPMGGLGGYSGGGGMAGVPFGVPLTATIFRL